MTQILLAYKIPILLLLQTAVALFLVSLAVGVCVASGAKETKYYTGGADPRASLAQKILIPVVIVVAAGVAAPLFLLSFDYLGKPRVRNQFCQINFFSNHLWCDGDFPTLILKMCLEPMMLQLQSFLLFLL